jgi:hypothetical protein
MVADERKHNQRIASHRDVQLFLLCFQCETCKLKPVAYLIRRVGWKMILEGRSPIEHVEIPDFLPKTEARLFRDAVVAAQSGKTLAGIFYLRCFIEQFARRLTGISDKRTGNEILSAYQEQLPPQVRDHMPSLPSWYDKLSGPIHTASDDEAMFQEAQEQIVRHFDFRRIHNIPETPAKIAEDKKENSAES